MMMQCCDCGERFSIGLATMRAREENDGTLARLCVECGETRGLARSIAATSTFWRNLAVAAALEAARINGIRFCDGDVTWRPGCGRVMPELSEWEE